MIRKRLDGENRTEDQIRAHYNIETELAKKLKESTKAERQSGHLYTSVYNELFQRVPHHGQLARKADEQQSQRAIIWQLNLVERFVGKDKTIVEIGPGDCKLAFELCKSAKQVYGVDVSDVITDAARVPPNFSLIISNGTNIPLPDSSVDLVYSNQLMEHIHPEDAVEQLGEIFRVLKSGGLYLCRTPNKINGPWDISYYFDDVATGLHLKEYSSGELIDLLSRAGFERQRAYAGGRGVYVPFPMTLINWLEKFLKLMPSGIRISIGRSLPIRSVLGLNIVAVK